MGYKIIIYRKQFELLIEYLKYEQSIEYNKKYKFNKTH